MARAWRRAQSGHVHTMPRRLSRSHAQPSGLGSSGSSGVEAHSEHVTTGPHVTPHIGAHTLQMMAVHRRRTTGDEEVDRRLEGALDAVHADHDRELLFEILATGVRLAHDDTDRLDLKITAAAVKELRLAFRTFAPYRH